MILMFYIAGYASKQYLHDFSAFDQLKSLVVGIKYSVITFFI